jgi:formyl-CoA transferase
MTTSSRDFAASRADGPVDGEPRYAPTILCDKTSGLVAAAVILAALYFARRPAAAQFIEIPMLRPWWLHMVEHLHG